MVPRVRRCHRRGAGGRGPRSDAQGGVTPRAAGVGPGSVVLRSIVGTAATPATGRTRRDPGTLSPGDGVYWFWLYWKFALVS
jgi:hypothetical protein